MTPATVLELDNFICVVQDTFSAVFLKNSKALYFYDIKLDTSLAKKLGVHYSLLITATLPRKTKYFKKQITIERIKKELLQFIKEYKQKNKHKRNIDGNK